MSGTWANTTYFQNSDQAAQKTPPKGFDGVLTRPQWKGVVDFARAVNAEIITSFATSPGTRDAHGVWTPNQARPFLAYTQSVGGRVAAAEFMNEPTYAAMGGAPKGYDAAAYGRDVAVFRPFLKPAAPGVVFLGPGSVGEGGSIPTPPNSGLLPSEDLLKVTGPVFDDFSYHLYAAVSKRCASLGKPDKPQRTRPCPSSGSRVRTRSPPSMRVSAIGSRRASRSGLPKPLMPPAGATPGPRPS